MAITSSAVNLSTILLEKNRANGKGPSLLVSDWIEETGEAGFAGIEIWINHLIFSSRSEWELMVEKAGDADLPIAAITAVIPVDASDKSQKFRESLIEACDYFRPGFLKFSLPTSRIDDALGFVKEWSRDVPKDITLLFDAGEEAGLESLETARKLLDGGRFKAVLHPFRFSPKDLEAVLDKHGAFVANLGVEAKKGGERILLEEGAQETLKVIAAVGGRTFTGFWSLESTKGAGQPREIIEDLFDNAEKDLNFLIEAQTRAALKK